MRCRLAKRRFAAPSRGCGCLRQQRCICRMTKARLKSRYETVFARYALNFARAMDTADSIASAQFAIASLRPDQTKSNALIGKISRYPRLAYRPPCPNKSAYVPQPPPPPRTLSANRETRAARPPALPARHRAVADRQAAARHPAAGRDKKERGREVRRRRDDCAGRGGGAEAGHRAAHAAEQRLQEEGAPCHWSCAAHGIRNFRDR